MAVVTVEIASQGRKPIRAVLLAATGPARFVRLADHIDGKMTRTRGGPAGDRGTDVSWRLKNDLIHR